MVGCSVTGSGVGGISIVGFGGRPSGVIGPPFGIAAQTENTSANTILRKANSGDIIGNQFENNL